MYPKAVFVLLLSSYLCSQLYGCEIGEVKELIEKLEKNLTKTILENTEKKAETAEFPVPNSPQCPPVPSSSDLENCNQIRRFSRHELVNGIYTIQPYHWYKPVVVYCDFTTAGGIGWTLIQRRDVDYPVQENFDRNWEDYKKGFGSVKKDFWLGNDIIFALTNDQKMVLRIDMVDLDGTKVWAEYQDFYIENEFNNYTLRFGNYSAGNAGDGLKHHKNRAFTTLDKDNDSARKRNCAASFKGGWWYFHCAFSLLNTPAKAEDVPNNFGAWYNLGENKFRHYLKKVEMKVRPLK